MAAIIFDFDGTIADSFDYVVGFFCKQSSKRLSQDEITKLRGLSMTEMADAMGFKWWQRPRLFFSGRSQMKHSIKNIEPIPGMAEVVSKLHSEGHQLFIVSSNSAKNINRFMEHHQMAGFFVDILGSVGLYGKSNALKRILKKHSLDKKDAWHIGDELRDVRASQSIGLRIIAVSWGFARPERLAQSKPTALAHSPDEIIAILEEA